MNNLLRKTRKSRKNLLPRELLPHLMMTTVHLIWRKASLEPRSSSRSSKKPRLRYQQRKLRKNRRRRRRLKPNSSRNRRRKKSLR
jgi:hypothetical protein